MPISSPRTQIIECVSYNRSGHNIIYIGDVEGDWEQFCRPIEHSRGLRFLVAKEHHTRCLPADLEMNLEDDWHFVFGGDALDKGPGTLRILDAVVMVKNKWPTRVHLLFGNRDVNKMGWVPALAKLDTGIMKGLVNLWNEDEGCTRHVRGEFECRRHELAHLKGMRPHEVTDDNVVESYADSLKAGGCLAEFLKRAQLAILLGDNLFADGQVKKLISKTMGEKEEDALRQWVDDLNAWGRNRAASLMLNPVWDPPPPPLEADQITGTSIGSAGLAENEYSIFVSKSSTCCQLGIEMEAKIVTEIFIKNVQSTGLVGTWNSRNPNHQVKPGDKLISANGVALTVNNLQMELTNSRHLTLVFRKSGE